MKEVMTNTVLFSCGAIFVKFIGSNEKTVFAEEGLIRGIAFADVVGLRERIASRAM